jgi:phosphoribosylformimino-5-aminoimidazole carboxamide ribotide isomerase
VSRPLTLYPAIDLRGGHAVRLERGDPARETRYDADPVARARAFVAAGARALHVVDLDGAFGTGENQAALRAICAAVEVPVQTGGGIRSRADVRARLDAGAHAVVIGTLLVEQPDDARALAAEYGARIVAGIDARGDAVATRGWLAESGASRDDGQTGTGAERYPFHTAAIRGRHAA